jgi:hypothetical protein
MPVDRSHASTDGRDVVVPYTVPADASARDYLVTASCGDAHNNATFTVVAPKKEPMKASLLRVTPPPTLAIQPTSGRPGDQMRIAGERFACANGTVELAWDDGTGLSDTPVDA